MSKRLITLFLSLCLVSSLFSFEAVSTFESIGLYWDNPVSNPPSEAQVTYREVPNGELKTGHPLWYDARDNQFRGSIVYLRPNTTYEITLNIPGGPSETQQVKTWPKEFPIAQTIELPSLSTETLVINQSGTENGYILYTFGSSGEAVIDVQKQSAYNIEIRGGASYVIIRGLELVNAAEMGIFFSGPSHDVVIEKNNLHDWGQPGVNNRRNDGIRADGNNPVERIIIQRNKIHNPTGRADSWASGHPGGPLAIAFNNSAGNHVIRYNEIYSSWDHYFQDGMGGGTNASYQGFPGPDTDIYGNYVAHVWDDGIECEGGGRNVRVWNNFIEETYVKFAIATVSLGPIYIFDNVMGTSRKFHDNDDPDQYDRGAFIKAGGRTGTDGNFYGDGKTYVYNNTVLQPDPPAGSTLPLGCKGGIMAHGGVIRNLTAKNNIILRHSGGGAIFTDGLNDCSNELDYNVVNGSYGNNCTSNPHGQNSVNTNINSIGMDEQNTVPYVLGANEIIYPILSNSPARNVGDEIPNFCDGFEGTAPDAGAFEFGEAPIQIGINAIDDDPVEPDTLLAPGTVLLRK